MIYPYYLLFFVKRIYKHYGCLISFLNKSTLSLSMREQKQIDELTLFFPAYNEEENIALCIENAKKAAEKYVEKWEILVIVFGGSSDRTKEIVKEYEKKDKRIKLIIQPKERKGIGTAYKIGFEAAKYKNVFYCDSDNQFNPEEIKRFLPYIDDYDIITGYRINRQDAKGRILASGLYNVLMRMLFPIKEKDIDCAFRLVKRKIFDKVRMNATTGVMTGEMLAKARIAGYKITQVGITHYPRVAGEARFEIPAGLNVPKPRVVLETIKEVQALKMELKEELNHYYVTEQEKKKTARGNLWKETKDTATIFWNVVLLRQCPLCKSHVAEKNYPKDLTQYGMCINPACSWGKPVK